MALCIVSFVDPEGLRHSVEVEAESLYEAETITTNLIRFCRAFILRSFKSVVSNVSEVSFGTNCGTRKWDQKTALFMCALSLKDFGKSL
jgi:hypothetical protein